ncbi:MAG: PQQ-binding-like beta-propeller repeat protein [Polyangiales bacterium]
MRKKYTYDFALITCLLFAGCVGDTPDDTQQEQVQEEAPSAQVGGASQARWLTGGHDGSNTRHQALETRISPQTVGSLKTKWTFRTSGGIGATPAVDETAVYVPDNSGAITAVDRITGKQIWQRDVGQITGNRGSAVRVTPAIDGDLLIAGEQSAAPAYSGAAHLFALNKKTGATVWNVVLDSTPIARVAQSPAIHGDLVYVGLSSFAERLSTGASFKCCAFRGNFVALNKKTGAVVWRTFMTPGPETGFSGVAIWSSTPVIDTKRNQVVITTGNNYTAPAAFNNCGNLPVSQVENCLKSIPRANENYFDAVVAMDLTTGKVKWAKSLQPFDVWVTACTLALGRPGGNCQSTKGHDYDFGQGAIAFSANGRDLLGAGQKSGIYYAVSADDGSVAWQTNLGPGGFLGGMAFGSAYDGKRFYTANVVSGAWSAADATTGRKVWDSKGTPSGTGSNPGSVSSANGVVFGGLLSGGLYALDGATGKTLWYFRAAGASIAGPAIVDGTVYWGTGGGQLGASSPTSQLYAFEVSGAGTVTPPPPPVDAGRPNVDAGPPPAANSWRSVFAKYLGPETVGHCNNCHLEMEDSALGYTWLAGLGQIKGATSPLGIQGQSKLIWLGGNMPMDGKAADPAGATAVTAIKAWIAAGAPNN